MSAVSGVTLAGVQLDGSQIIPASVRDKIVSPWLGKQVTFVEIELIRNELTMWLVDNGFTNSGVVIPDQEVAGGTVRMQVIAGHVTGIDVSGTNYFSARYFRSRLEIATAPPFNLTRLRDALQLLQQDPQVRSLNANLAAAARPGESRLAVKVSEGKPWSVQFITTNDATPATGSYRGEVALAYRNAIGYGDLLSARVGGTEGGYDVAVSGISPVTPFDTMVELFYRHGDYKVIDPLYKKLDIRSNAQTYGARLSHPLVKNIRREILPLVSLERRESRNFLLQQGFSFSDKEVDGFSKLTAARLGVQWLERSPSSVLVVSSAASFAVDTSEFLSWYSRLQWLRRTGWRDTRLLLRGDAQLAGRSLPPMEKFALGGMNSVRGIRKNIMVRDNALGGSLEFVVPLLVDNQGSERVALSAFFDYGRGWDHSSGELDSSGEEIAGSGLALRISWLGVTADLAYALPVLRPANHTNEELQDKGIHFLVSWSL